MSEEDKTASYAKHGDDPEAGNSHRDYVDDDDDDGSGPFDIVRTKSAPYHALRRWRQAALVLNASRRFRYTMDMKKEKEKKQLIAKIRMHAQVIRAAVLFQEAGQHGTSTLPLNPTRTANSGISSEELVSISKAHDNSLLQQNGGVKGLAEKLKSNLEKGVPGDEADLVNRKTAFGSNTYPRKEGRSFWRFVWDACRDSTLIILMAAAAASLALGIKTEGIKEGWYDGGSIALAVIIVIIFTAVSDYRQSLQFQNLNEEKQNIQIEVIRGGRRIKVSIFEIVVGDVVPLKIGDQVPADGLVISSHSLSIDESSMTGESKIVHKDSIRAPFLMSGCKVADGYGTMLVISVGLNTEWGLLMASISEDNGEETPLQVRLNGVATFIGMVGLAVAVVVLVILVVRFFTGHTRDPDGRVQFIAGKTKVADAIDGFVKIFTVTVAIVVVAVPEGLPLAVTLTLAYSMRKIMADKALVRRLSACETMGSANTICSDKTGTLTLNQMAVVTANACGKKIDPPDNKLLFPPIVTSLLIEGIAQNTTGSVFVAEGGGALELSGSPTEKAILQWGVNLGMDFDAVRSDSVIIHAYPFNSEKKQGGVALKLSDSEVRVHWKGAAEIVLASCTGYIDENDNVVPMDRDKLSYFEKAIEDMAAGSLRCVAIAYRPYEIEKVPSSDEELENWQLPETDLILLAIVGIKDPCRPGVRDAVQLCTNAGVKVRMVTGDNLQTAKAIALECGILGSNGDASEPNIIEGRTFRNLTEAQRLEVADRISVMGRSSPNDKLLLVQALRKRGNVVAVTGDGTNDAPALHEADIGLSMGIQGTEVAKESSDIIILDDNFASIVKVVRWGRSVYANIQKFIQFQLTVNIAALIINVVAAVSSGNVPLNAVQLLWVNLIMDTLGALALATEPPTDHLMHRPPVGRREPLITNIMWRNLMIQVLYQVTVLLVLNFRGRSILNLDHDTTEHASKVTNTLIFNAFVFCQVFNEFNARKPDEINVWKGITKSHLFKGIVALEVVLQIMIIFFLGKFTSTVRLSWKLWLVSLAIGIISWPLAAVGKLIPVPESAFGESLKRQVRRGRNTDGGRFNFFDFRTPIQANKQDIEKLLLQYGPLALRSYKYSEIKKITKSFNDKLGQGGYGSVYKGMLPDGSLVAVKVLIETDSDGEEFINEVASISRTSHVNIVTLLGFCYDGKKRALVYEFMPNKSLDKFLSNNGSASNTDCGLNFKILYKIAVGIAKGLDYLHTGCKTRIVHFDIKPQNILLDEDFCPKISDFGLAKLCKKKQSIFSEVGTRGTIGYIAPEMLFRNIGGVSHKYDVYSYGMMVLEMAGAKKIVEADANQSSENYFPDKIYEHVLNGVTGKVDDFMFKDDEIAKKLFLVGFWCIQMTPSDRPSMSKVVEMLEGSLQSIQIPPKPNLFGKTFPPAVPEQNISSSLSLLQHT